MAQITSYWSEHTNISTKGLKAQTKEQMFLTEIYSRKRQVTEEFLQFDSKEIS